MNPSFTSLLTSFLKFESKNSNKKTLLLTLEIYVEVTEFIRVKKFHQIPINVVSRFCQKKCKRNYSHSVLVQLHLHM